MRKDMGQKKFLAIATVGICVLSFIGAVLGHFMMPKNSMELKSHFLSFGESSAPVDVVLIEDFQCKNCRTFSQKLIPNLKSSYIKSGRVRFVLVPVSFLAGSQMISNAALEVYYQSPNRFFQFLDSILAHEGVVRKEDIIRFARRMRGINLAKLERCMDLGCHNKELKENLAWAQKFMGAQFRTPALYVNGDVGSTYSFEAVKYQIEQVLGEQ